MMDALCDSPLWDWNIAWYSNLPDVPTCAQNTILSWIPCGILAIWGSVEMLQNRKRKRISVPLTLLYIFKAFCLVILCILSIVELILWHGSVATFLTSSMYILAFIFVGFIERFLQNRGNTTSPALFSFWLLLSICECVKFRSVLLDAFNVNYARNTTTEYFIMTIIRFPLVLGQLFVSFFAEIFTQFDKKACLSPETKASFPSKLTFWWFNPMAKLGFKQPLKIGDIWQLDYANMTQNIVNKFAKYWNKEKLKKSRVLTKACDVKGEAIFESRVSLLLPIMKTFGTSMLGIISLKVIAIGFTFVNPQILNALISFMSSNEPNWHGMFYATAICLSAMSQSFLENQYEYRLYILGLKIRAAVISTIYCKSLTLSNDARVQYTTGEIVNLMAVDSERITDYVNIANLIWSAPLQICLSIYFLWQQLGIATLGGLFVILMLMPSNFVITSYARKYQIRIMKDKDRRIKLLNEVLNGIRVLKLYAWESSFIQRVNHWRNQELISLRKQAFINAAMVFLFNAAPFLVALASFGTYVLIDSANVLNANKAFVSLSLFNILRPPMNMFPRLLTNTALFLVSLNRLNAYLRSSDLDDACIDHTPDDNYSVVIDHGTFSWDCESDPVLRDINLRVPKGSIVAVIGAVGAGKSALLSALLGNLCKRNGRINVDGTVAYVPQQAWIMNATIRENILFGLPYERARYETVIASCCLRPDFHILPGGDLTEVGERGINLSGGQKQRVSMARALYHEADIYYLDDPLSAVDAHVGKDIFENVISCNGLLAKKTRIFITHRLTMLPEVDQIFVLKNGQISESGCYSVLIAKNGAFAEYIAQHVNNPTEEDDVILMDEPNSTDNHTPGVVKQQAIVSDDVRSERSDSLRKIDTIRKRSTSVLSSESAKQNKMKNFKAMQTNEEVAAVGSVKKSIYWDYFKTIGVRSAIFTVLSFLLTNAFNMATSFWLSAWSNDSLDPTLANDVAQRNYRLGIYALFGTFEILFVLWGSISLNLDVLRASKILHENMLERIMRAPMCFFDTTPMGRILNRFAKDVDTADTQMRMNLRQFFVTFFKTWATLIMIASESSIFLILAVPLGILYYTIQRYYIPTSRQLKRLVSISRSPIYVHFSETITGAQSIRAYRATNRFVDKSNNLTDTNNKCYLSNATATRWLAIRLEFLGYMIVFLTAVLAVYERGTLSPGAAGLSISYAMTMTNVLSMLVRASSDIETNFVSIERCIEYSKTPVEAPWYIEETKPRDSWPNNATIVFDNYSTRYRKALPLVLKKISCKVKPGEKVGVVGRTGAGKSSITLALFRIVEAVNGKIIIDDIDIDTIGLHDLRSKLTIIPQDPVLFNGTLRMNLDPFNCFQDEDLWKALQHAHLKNFVSSLEEGLDHTVSEGGENLSVGQRQLVCLARALLRKSKILVLDEATAAVDMETDQLIQTTIRAEFSDCTILTIAHRLNTIMDYDRILVLEQGQIVEFDTPRNLLSDSNGAFYGMAKNAGLVV